MAREDNEKEAGYFARIEVYLGTSKKVLSGVGGGTRRFHTLTLMCSSDEGVLNRFIADVDEARRIEENACLSAVGLYGKNIEGDVFQKWSVYWHDGKGKCLV